MSASDPKRTHSVGSSESHQNGRRCGIGRQLLVVQIILFQKFGPEVLWRSGNVWPALWRKVHEIPIRPHRIDMIRRQLSCPEMKDLSILPPKHMHHWPLHIIGLSLAFVVGL